MDDAGLGNVVDGGKVVHEVEGGRDGDGGGDSDGPVFEAGIADDAGKVAVPKPPISIITESSIKRGGHTDRYR